MRKVRMTFNTSEIIEIEKLISELEHATSDKQKGIRAKLRKKGLYWSEFAQGCEYTLANFHKFVEQGVILVDKKGVLPATTTSTKSAAPNIKTEERIECFAPIVDSESKILILGTMPSPESLRKGEYYANSRNSFWKIIATIYNDGKEFESYEEKINCIHKNHLALWDVFSSCEREGALDSNIKQEIPNDLIAFLESHPSINKVVLNGHEAEKAFAINFPHEYVMSSSPANAKSLETKVSDWASKLK